MKIKNASKWLPTKSWHREGLSIALTLLAVFSIRYSLAEPYVVPTGSMEPTIMPGDRLWVNKAAYDLRVPFTNWVLAKIQVPARGEVIVFKYPADPSIYFVKRLIGLPGDSIRIESDGTVWINGAKAPENLQKPSDVFSEPLVFRVPTGHYFFMGDNRDHSNDSRSWGFVPHVNLQGRAVGIWLSLGSSIGTLPSVRWNRFGIAL